MANTGVGVRALAFSGKQLVVASSHDEPNWTWSVRFWNPETGAVNGTHEIRRGGPGADAVAASPDGSLVAAVAVYSDDSDQDPGPDRVQRLSRWQHLHVWDARTGELQLKRKMSSLVTSLAFTPDGKLLATGSRKGIMFWDTETFEPKGEIKSSRESPPVGSNT